jgi:16S rRNA (cytosine967-C5)-methyltransferase
VTQRTARAAAIALVAAVTGEGRRLSDLLPGALDDLPPEGRARAQRLAVETLRWADRADRLLGPYLRLKPAPVPLAALRLGAWEVCAGGGQAAGVVNDCVTAVRTSRETGAGPGGAGLVNAVLRKVAAEGPAKWATLPVPHLPKALRKRLLAAWGKDGVAAIETAHAAGAALDLTPRDGDAAGLAARLGGVALPTGSVRLADAGQVTALPGWDDGAFWVQDAAAAIPARVVHARPGERVADLCAAPGGKTLQLAAAGAAVTAVDVSADRMVRVAQNLARTGLAATLVTADALTWQPDAPFDAVLLDAPCSATGTIRRHPDLPHALDLSGLPDLLALQARLIDRAVALVRPGGRIVYATCSLLPEEGEAQVTAALARHPGLSLDLSALDLPGLDPAWCGPDGLRLRPDLWAETGGIDGFFVAALRVAG